MGYEEVYGPRVPCPCGAGTAIYSRTEHDQLRGLVLCEFYFVPKEQVANVNAFNVADAGFGRAAEPGW